MNLLSSLNGVLSRINPDPVDIFKPDTDPDIVVHIGGERFVCGVDDKLVGVSVEYNVKGGGLCTLEWAYFQIYRIGAPVTVYSVFKNREVKVINEQGNEEYIYPVDFIGKVSIGQDPVSGAYYPPVANYFLYQHREERYEIDAPYMLPQTALRDAYALLRRIKPTTKIQVPYYRYAKNQIPVGASMRVLTHNSLNISLTVPIARKNVPVNPSARPA